MKSRLFCRHCEKHYEVDVNDIKFMQLHQNEHLSYDRNTYYYTNGCFFKTLNTLKRTHNDYLKMGDDTLKWLEDNGYIRHNINHQGSYGNTALMKASREGNEAVVSELLEAGADISIKNVDGNQALWLACFGENQNVLNMLIDAGIDIDTQNVNGVTPLMYVSSSGKEKMVEMLLKAGADVSIQNPDDFTALDLAVTPKILRMLRGAA